MDVKLRFAHAEVLAEQYERFEDFAEDGMAFLGFPLTAMQRDISEFMQYGDRLRMIMAQRGEAKSTLAALYAVWRLIHRPSTRVLVVSGGEKQASEVATLIIRLIMTWDILEYLRPDKQSGDRVSIEAFDVHFALKGLDKSPSVACIGITANLQGKRADILIADDIETTKNGLTVTQRSQLLQLSKEFSSICTHGDILYLGTPQTKDSIYNTLPGRGFIVRIWPGRFPTQEELPKYGDRLAPYVADRIKRNKDLQNGGGLDGTKGKPTDTGRYTETDLCEKELDQGPEGFQLQYMLDTTLSDAARQQLRLSDFIVANYTDDRLPEISVYQSSQQYQVELPGDFPIPLTKMYHPVPIACDFIPRKDVMMYIDPAGGGSDELAFGVSCAIGPYIHVLDCGGLKGGLTGKNPEKIIQVARELDVGTILVESNMGHGLFEITLRAEFEKAGMGHVGIRGEYSTGQKERRIIDSLVAPMQRHRVIVHQRVFQSDTEYNKQHSIDKRAQYSVWYQLSNITTDRNSLPHDDRCEAFAGCVRYWKGVLAVDENRASEARKLSEAREFMQNPMGYPEKQDRLRGARKTVQTRRQRY